MLKESIKRISSLYKVFKLANTNNTSFLYAIFNNYKLFNIFNYYKLHIALGYYASIAYSQLRPSEHDLLLTSRFQKLPRPTSSETNQPYV